MFDGVKVNILNTIYKMEELFKDTDLKQNVSWIIRDLKNNYEPNVYNLPDESNGIAIGNWNKIKYKFLCDYKSQIEKEAMFQGAWDIEVLDIMDALIPMKPGKIIDVGANVGLITIPLALKYPDRDFVCFEPHPISYEKLQLNLQLNKCKNITTHNKAISNSIEDYITLYLHENSGLSSTSKINNSASSKIVERVYLSYVKGKVSLIKLDIEGAELDALKSGVRLIDVHRPNIVFEYDPDHFDNPIPYIKKLHEFLLLYDYKIYAIMDSRFMLDCTNDLSSKNYDTISFCALAF